jgi:hypothetical protein
LGHAHSPAGAIAFAVYWFEALDWGYATTSSTLARSLFLPVCTDCERFMSNFDDARQRGIHFRGGRLSISEADIATNDRRHGADNAADVTIDVGPLQRIDSRGHVVARGAATNHVTFRVWLRWTTAAWRVVDFKRVVFR